jgi:hypothetical protein
MRSTRRLIPAAGATILVAAMALTGCGDDEAEAGTLTEAEFVEQANALCATQAQAIGRVIGPLFAAGQPSPQDQQAALDQIVTLSRSLADDIGALVEPRSLTADIEELVKSLDAGTDEAAKQTGAAFFGSDEDPWADAQARAHDLGLDACVPQE